MNVANHLQLVNVLEMHIAVSCTWQNTVFIVHVNVPPFCVQIHFLLTL